MAVRPDNRLEDGPLTQVECEACGTDVRVRKSSWEQTSIQWDRTALESCLERPVDPEADLEATTEDAVFMGCEALRRSIADAAVRGELPVMDPSDTPVNTEHDQDGPR